MGIKALKEAFKIEHSVAVYDKGICIGSGYVHDLVVINPATGELKANPTFTGMSSRYPELFSAPASVIRELLAKEDAFERSIPVFTYKGSQIIEKHCEEPGYPNTTHDGDMMYDNTHSTDRTKVIAWAKRDASISIESISRQIEQSERELSELKARLAKRESILGQLHQDYPEPGSCT